MCSDTIGKKIEVVLGDLDVVHGFLKFYKSFRQQKYKKLIMNLNLKYKNI